MYVKKDDLIRQIAHCAVLRGHELTSQQINDLSRLSRKQLVRREGLIISGYTNAIYALDTDIETFHIIAHSDMVTHTNLSFEYAKSL